MKLKLIAALLACQTAHAAPTFSHVIIVFQENRTPDNIFGSNPNFEPGVDIATSGLNSMGQTIPLGPVALATCYDIGHTHESFLTMYHNGKMDGADRVTVTLTVDPCIPPANPQFKYADNSTGVVQPYFDIATQYGFANRMFQTNEGPSFPAHLFIFGGTSAPTPTSPLFLSENNAISNTGVGCTADPGQRVVLLDPAGSDSQFAPIYPCVNMPTLSDELDSAALPWKYYLDTLAVGSIWNAPGAIRHICVPKIQAGARYCSSPEYNANVPDGQAQILTDIADCNLAKVSWVIPSAENSDHAGVGTDTGPAWVTSIVNAVGQQSTCPGGETYWHDTAILITWDDWGGWYDHVPPFRVGGQKAHEWGKAYTYGLRVPLLVVSAYTPAGFVDNINHDFGSILRFTETNFGLPHIGPGYYADAFASNLMEFFQLQSPRPFVAIPAKWNGAYFQHQPPSSAPVDND
jgi:phospholipase C